MLQDANMGMEVKLNRQINYVYMHTTHPQKFTTFKFTFKSDYTKSLVFFFFWFTSLYIKARCIRTA